MSKLILLCSIPSDNHKNLVCNVLFKFKTASTGELYQVK